MTIKEIEPLVNDWGVAVAALWRVVVNKAAEASVAVPAYETKIDAVQVILSIRGIDIVLNGQESSLRDLIFERDFKLGNFAAIRSFVVDSIAKGRAEVRRSIAERKAAMETVFGEMKNEIAEWNLIAPKGEEVKP
jgi:hypothetical protein